MSRIPFLAALTAVLVVVAIVSAIPSLRVGGRAPTWLIRWGDPLAAGIFLGAGLVHLLPDAAIAYQSLGIAYPWPFALCGAAALLLAILERRGRTRHGAEGSALIAAAALSLHSLLAGAALGATARPSAVVVLFLALVAHKGATSFSLSRLLCESGLGRPAALAAQAVFVTALPMGVLTGAAITARQHEWPLALPLALSLGAGTFVYFGTLHRGGSQVGAGGDGRRYWLEAIGFGLMALIAAVA